MSPSKTATGIACLITGSLAAVAAPAGTPQSQPNPSGAALTFTKAKRIDTANPYFQSLGTNGRSCVSCHTEASGWSVTPAELQARFEATGGTDPIFRTNDGSNSPDADVSTPEARQAAYSMLLTKGLIRVGLPLPANAEFTLVSVDDPYGHASAADLSLFRRPLPAANLKFITTVMWDGRQTTPGQTPAQNLASQATDATLGHAQAANAPSPAQLTSIVAFESSLFHAQVTDDVAGSLTTKGAKGGPKGLAKQKFTFGVNDPFPPVPSRKPFNPDVFKLFTALKKSPRALPAEQREARAAIARGEINFNRRPFFIRGVKGLNDVLNMPTITGTCATCHNTPGVGSSSTGLLMDLGVSDASRRTADLPLYTLRRTADGAELQTTDPGRALITGQWADIGKFKVPSMRGLAARAPYFHNGASATLADVVQFYSNRFGINYSDQEKLDLEAFLRSL